MLKCAGDYNPVKFSNHEAIIGPSCNWTGEAEDCEFLNGEPICPKCGSSVVEDYARN